MFKQYVVKTSSTFSLSYSSLNVVSGDHDMCSIINENNHLNLDVSCIPYLSKNPNHLSEFKGLIFDMGTCFKICISLSGVYPIVKNAKPYGKFIIDGINLTEAQEGRDIISLLGIQEKVEAQKDEKGKPITKFRSIDGLFKNPLFIDNIRSSHIEIRDNLLGKNPTLESKRKTIETVLKFFKPFQIFLRNLYKKI